MSLYRPLAANSGGIAINFDLWEATSGARHTYAQMYGGIQSSAQNDTDGMFVFKTVQDGAMTEAMRIAKNKVGINQNTPTYHLDVNSGTEAECGRFQGDSWTELNIVADTNDATLKLTSGTDVWSLHNDDSASNVLSTRYNNVEASVMSWDTYKLFHNSTGNACLEFGGPSATNTYIDLVGDSTYTDYGFRIIRSGSSENGGTTMVHRGTGDLQFKTNEAGAMAFYTTAVRRLLIRSGGTVEIPSVYSTDKTSDTTRSVVVDSAGELGYSTTSSGGVALSDDNNWTGVQSCSVTSLTSTSASIAVNLAQTNNYSHTTTENTTLANPSGLTVGQSGVLVITQGATARTMAFASTWKFRGGVDPTLTNSPYAKDMFTYYVDSSTSVICQLVKGLA